MTDIDPDRRKILMASGTAVTVALAGCTGDDDDGNGNGNGDGDALEDHMDGANWDGQEQDLTDQDSVEVENGANEPDYAFDPAVIRVSEGTEVTWVWVSDNHSVTESDGSDDWDAEDVVEDEGHEFSYTFEDAGTYLYHCQPHVAFQRGAVIVE